MENKAQQEAIAHGDGPMLVLAGPGSGKTFVLTRHIRYLINSHGIPPEQILVITFTRAAAREMRDRFISLMEGEHSPVHFGTFHSIFYQLLRQHFNYAGFQVISKAEKSSFFQKHETATAKISGMQAMDEAALYFNTLKLSSNVTMPEAGKAFLDLVDEYRRYCHRIGKLDLDDLANLLYERLSGDPGRLETLRAQYRYILIDEYQDINASQYRMVRLLAEPSNNVFAVGDDDQSIYAFRGSEPGIMLNFEKDFPGAKRVNLSTNFRSDLKVVEAAGMLIRKNTSRFEKEVRAFSKEEGRVRLQGFSGRKEEYAALLEALKGLMKEKKLTETAVIFRNRAQVESLAARLLKEGIPFTKKEAPKSLFEQPEVLAILAILRFASGSRDRGDFLKFCNLPPRGIEREALSEKRVEEEALLKFYAPSPAVSRKLRKLFSDLRFIQGKPPFLAIRYILEGFSLRKHLEFKGMREGKSKEQALEAAEELLELSREFDLVQDLLLFAAEYGEKKVSFQEGQGDVRGVRLYTMHGSKGLEFDTVFLPSLLDSHIPGPKAIGREQVEEERRILYVAMTRARHELFLSYYTGGGESPSSFLEGLMKTISS